jgi:hypothetical protein
MALSDTLSSLSSDITGATDAESQLTTFCYATLAMLVIIIIMLLFIIGRVRR